jgi:hypothetical protein
VTGSAACGVLYVAQGERYLAKAAVSAAIVQRHMPGLRTTIFCDGEVRSDLFDERAAPGLLPPAYNYRLPFPSTIRGEVKIFHGRHPDLAALCATINASTAFRATAPARSPVLRYGTETLEPSMGSG